MAFATSFVDIYSTWHPTSDYYVIAYARVCGCRMAGTVPEVSVLIVISTSKQAMVISRHNQKQVLTEGESEVARLTRRWTRHVFGGAAPNARRTARHICCVVPAVIDGLCMTCLVGKAQQKAERRPLVIHGDCVNAIVRILVVVILLGQLWMKPAAICCNQVHTSMRLD